MAFARRLELPSRSVEAKVTGEGLDCAKRPANVVLVHVAEPPVYAAGLPASLDPFRYARKIGSGEVPVPAPKYANEPARLPPAALLACRFAMPSLNSSRNPFLIRF